MSDTVCMENNGQNKDSKSLTKRQVNSISEQFVLEKSIFSNVFDKDIKRVYIYKKSERIAKALHMVCPAFKDCRPLRERLERLSVELIDASILSPSEARERLPKHLLSLASSLEMGKAGGFLSTMNADLILRETHHLLQEVASYEEPRLSLPEAPSVARIMRETPVEHAAATFRHMQRKEKEYKGQDTKGQTIVKNVPKSGRKEAILSVLSSKGPSYIKDISMVIRDVSEKTIQRELQSLVLQGMVEKRGEKRWTTYTVTGAH